MSETLIFEEVIDPDYEPTQEEIIECAELLGMKLPENESLLYIAREALKAHIPKPWLLCQSSDQEVYFFNPETNQSTWESPNLSYYRDIFLLQQSKCRNNDIRAKIFEPISPINFEEMLDENKIDLKIKEQQRIVREKYENWLIEQTMDMQIHKEEHIKEFKLKLEIESENNDKQRLKDLSENKTSSKQNSNLKVHELKQTIEEVKLSLIENCKLQMEIFCKAQENELNSIVEKEAQNIEDLKAEKQLIVNEERSKYNAEKKKRLDLLKEYETECESQRWSICEILKEKVKIKKEEIDFQVESVKRQINENPRGFKERLNKLRQDYSSILESEMKRLESDFNSKLAADANSDFESEVNNSILEEEKVWAIDEISQRYEILYSQETEVLDKQCEDRLTIESQRLQSEFATHSVSKDPDIYSKIIEIENEISEIDRNASIKDSQIRYLESEISDYRSSINTKRSQVFYSSQISKLKDDFKTKFKEIEKVLNESPKKISKLERDIEYLKRSFYSPINSEITRYSGFDFSTEESKRKFSHRNNSWNMPRDASPIQRYTEDSSDITNNESFYEIIGKHKSWVSDMKHDFSHRSKQDV